MSSVGSALEALLLRVVPGLATSWQGAEASDVARIEAIAGRPLPPLYTWFLSRMGQSMGAMGYPTIDFSARGILSAYSAHRIERHPRFLLLGYEHDEVSPLHYFYDLDRPARDDALVVRMLTPKDESHEQFETFGEMLAWGELYGQRVAKALQQCRGTLRAASGDLHGPLESVLRGLGFATPIETGAFCGLYERSDAALVCSGNPDDVPGTQTFNLGGNDAGALGQILSSVANGSSLDVTLSGWEPPLPSDG